MNTKLHFSDESKGRKNVDVAWSLEPGPAASVIAKP